MFQSQVLLNNEFIFMPSMSGFISEFHFYFVKVKISGEASIFRYNVINVPGMFQSSNSNEFMYNYAIIKKNIFY